MSELLPIETAPFNEWVIITGGRVDAFWDEDDFKPPCVIAMRHKYSGREETLPFFADGVWFFACYDAGFYGSYENPTHWMPLPAGLARKIP